MLALEAFSDAEPILRECLTIRAKQEPEAWTTFNARSMLGGALLGQKNYADAEPLLVQGYQGMKQCETKIRPQVREIRLTEALERLVRLYEGWGRPQDAGLWRKRLEQVSKQKEQPRGK